MTGKLKFDQLIEIDGQKLNKKFIESLSKEERLNLVEPLFNILRETGFIYMDDVSKINKSWERLKKYEPDLSSDSIFNNSSLGTDICKFFCHSFYDVREKDKPSLVQVFNDDNKLRRVIKNRLGLDWFDKGDNEAFNLTYKMFAFQGPRSMRLVIPTSMFKPSIAKHICMKYSEKGDLVGDYSAGFGGRMLGALSCERRYQGTDPLTVPELRRMANHFNLDVKLIQSGSEHFKGDENSLDLCWSSPPYFDQEYYSNDDTQAYVKGEEYFYETYWKNTLQNARYMLKPGKWFGLNVKNYPRMVEMAIDVFGPVQEQLGLRTVRSHLNKTAGVEKNEYVYMFINKK